MIISIIPHVKKNLESKVHAFKGKVRRPSPAPLATPPNRSVIWRVQCTNFTTIYSLPFTDMLINQIKKKMEEKHILNDSVSGGPMWPGN